ncbi:MAG: hypothetical protein JXQ83_12235 [Candidatus Glassbacteria bacterium]|nr:hypothetical protein [Candidatus Glassbacteria bacterium]
MKKHQGYIWPQFWLLAWIWISTAVSFTGWPWAWGLIPLGPGEGAWRLAAGLVCTAVLLARETGERLLLQLKEKLPLIGWGKKPRYVKALVWGLLWLTAVFLAWSFRSRNHFMGDGFSLIGSVAKPFYLYGNEPLDFFLHQSFYRLLAAAGLGDGQQAYAVLHCLLFPFFLLACWKIAVRVDSRGAGRPALWLLFVSTSALQLFCGYVESYTVVQLWLAVYLLYGIRELQTGKSRCPWLPSAIFLLAAATHASAAALFPSLLFLWLEKVRFLRSSRAYGSLLVIAVSGLLLAAVLFKTGTASLVPLAGRIDGSDYPYRLFEITHLWDKFNFLMLICLPAVIAIPLILARLWTVKQAGSPAFFFVFWCAAGCAFFSAVYNPDLGVRDWDLLSLPALPLAVFSGMGLVLLWPADSFPKSFLAALSLTVLVHSLAWVWVNSDLDRGIRFLDRVRLAYFHRGSDRVQLGFQLSEMGYYREANRQYCLTRGEKWRPRADFNLGTNFLELEMPDSTLYYYRNYFEKEMNLEAVQQAYADLAVAYDMLGRPDSAAVLFLNMKEAGLEPEGKQLLWYLNKMALLADRYYNHEFIKNSGDLDLLVFFLRFYTLARDEKKLDETYRFSLTRHFSKDDWLRLIAFAKVCGHQEYLEKINEAMLQQHPGLEGKGPSGSDRD